VPRRWPTQPRGRFVADEPQTVDDSCRHAHPLIDIYTTAVNTARSPTRAVSPPSGCAANGGGDRVATQQTVRQQLLRQSNTSEDNHADLIDRQHETCSYL
jgi:hypothetical protein